MMKKLKLALYLLAACLLVGGTAVTANAAEVDTSITAPGSEETIVPAKLSTYESSTENLTTYSIKIPVGATEAVQAVKMDYKGLLKVELTGNILAKGVTVELYQQYTDGVCVGKVGYSAYLSSSSLTDTLKATIPAKGTYYLKFSYYSAAESDSEITIIPYSYSGENKTLKNKVWAGTAPANNEKPIYHKVTVTKPGYIKVEAKANDTYGGSVSNVALCNSKKKALTNTIYLSESINHRTFYAVKKGTYYISIKNSSDYKVRYTFYGVTDKGGASKGKATTIKKGATVKGLVNAEDKKTKYDWYKITLPKKQKLSLTISAKSNDSISFQVIPANSRLILLGNSFSLYREDSSSFTSKDALSKGTYYIRVSKSAATTAGYYQIKFR